MYTHLIKNIKTHFSTELGLIYNDKPWDENAYLGEYKNLVNSCRKYIHWQDLLTDKKSLFNDIDKWYSNETVFDYFLPATLIHCLRNRLENNEVLLFLMSQFEPSIYHFNICDYFYVLFYFDTEKRKVLSRFINALGQTPHSLLYQDEIIATQNTLAWLERRETLINRIYECFHTTDTLDYSEIAYDHGDGDGHRLSKQLQNKLWYSPDTIEYIKNIVSDLEYYELEPKAFAYFMPTCLVSSLSEVPGRLATVTGYTIDSLTWIRKPKDYEDQHNIGRYAYFCNTHKKIVIEFLELYLEIGVSGEDKLIQQSLENYWLIEVNNNKSALRG